MQKRKYFDFDLQLFADDGESPQNAGDNKDNTGNIDSTEPKLFDESYVKELRAEAAANRVKARELEKQLEEMPSQITAKVLEALGLSADPEKNFEKQLEDAQMKAREAEERANARLIRAEVKAVALEMNLVDADAALALMDMQNVSISDNGDVEGVKEALDALVEKRPWLVRKEDKKVGGGTNPADSDDGMNPWLKESFNLTEQGRIMREDPQLAAKLKAAAGK